MMNYPSAYIEYLDHYHRTRDYFECHEVLEEYWKQHPDSPYKQTWVGLIQLAVAMYHQRRGNWKGAVKMLSSSIHMLDPTDLEQLGVEAVELKNSMEQRLLQLEQNPQSEFIDLNIPFIDHQLEQHITAIRTDDLVTDPYVVNKHQLRDRSEVILARQAEWDRRHLRS